MKQNQIRGPGSDAHKTYCCRPTEYKFRPSNWWSVAYEEWNL